MNKTEREALKKILVALFLESPKRKALLGKENSEKTEGKTSRTHKTRAYQLGDTPNDKK